MTTTEAREHHSHSHVETLGDDGLQISQIEGELSIDKFLNRIGLGKAQVVVYALVMIYSLCDGAECMALSFLNVILKTEWNLSDNQVSLIGSLLFTGFFFGSVISGFVSDTYGRRIIFLISTAGIVVIGNISAFAPNYLAFIITRTIYGFFIGVLSPLTAVMVVEVTSMEWRGRMMMIVMSAFTAGELLGLLVAYFTLSSYATGDWRIMCMWVTIPAFVAFVGGLFFLKESPRFTIFRDFSAGVEILQDMYVSNTGQADFMSEEEMSELRHYIDRQEHSEELEMNNLRALFGGIYTRITLLVWFMWFAISFIYYGLLYIYPTILQALSTAAGDGNQTDFMPILLSCLGEIPSYIVGYFMVETVMFGRQNSLTLSFAGAAAFCVGAYWSRNTALSVVMFFCKFFAGSAFNFIYPFTSELYHTHHRATGMGMASGASRIGGILMPWISMACYQYEIMLPFIIFGACCAAASVASFFMPYDTQGKELDRLRPDHYFEERQKLITSISQDEKVKSP
jgi:MFS family permease